MHCFVSTISASARGTRWAWHTADGNGVSRVHSSTEFENFNACVDDARAHGYHHVEVPLLHWSCAQEATVVAVQPTQMEQHAIEIPAHTMEEAQ